jgi:hypothetical protein
VYSLGVPERGGRVSLADANPLISDAYTRYGLKWRGKVTDGRGRSSACFKPSLNHICLPTFARNRETILHEAAHGIIGELFPRDDVAWHGPEFARVMLELWAWAKLDTMTALREQARSKKVKVSASPKVRVPAAGAAKAYEDARAKVNRLALELAEAKKALEVARANLRPETGAVAARTGSH